MGVPAPGTLLYSTLIPCRYLSAALRCSSCFCSTYLTLLLLPCLLHQQTRCQPTHLLNHTLLYCTVRRKVRKEHLVATLASYLLLPLPTISTATIHFVHSSSLFPQVAPRTPRSWHSGNPEPVATTSLPPLSNLTYRTEHYLLLLVLLVLYTTRLTTTKYLLVPKASLPSFRCPRPPRKESLHCTD